MGTKRYAFIAYEELISVETAIKEVGGKNIFGNGPLFLERARDLYDKKYIAKGNSLLKLNPDAQIMRRF
jgi:hypothetical protein